VDVWQGTRTQLTPLSRTSKTKPRHFPAHAACMKRNTMFIGGSSSFNGWNKRRAYCAHLFSGLFLAA
jgi:hypothetical protein